MLLADTNAQDMEGEDEEESFIMPIKDLCSNPVYLLLVFAISSLYFVVSGL